MINAKKKLMDMWDLELITSNDLEREIKYYFKMTGQSENKMNYVESNIKTQKEIEEKLKEVEAMMRDNIPNEKDVKQLSDYMQTIENKTIISDEERMKILVKVMSRPPEVISLDAQLFILKWILYD